MRKNSQMLYQPNRRETLVKALPRYVSSFLDYCGPSYLAQLLRRMCDTIDMNTLAEGEECAICMEEMAVEKCYRSGASLHIQGFYLSLNSAYHADILSVLNVSNGWATVPMRCSTIRQCQSNVLIAEKSIRAESVK